MSAPVFPRISDQMLPQIRARFQRCQGDSHLGQVLLEKALASFGIFTGPDIFYAFLLSQLPPGEYLFAGTGPSAAGLIEAMQGPTSPFQIIGLVEVGHATSEAFMGCPVLTPKDAARADLPDLPEVIVCHPGLETSIVSLLLEAGVPSSRIRNITRHEDFKAFHDTLLEQEVVGRFLTKILEARAKVDHVILVPNGDLWMVVEEEVLKEVLPPESTIRLYYGPPGKMDASPYYPTFDVGQCLPLILRLLEALSPTSVYVRGSAQFKSEHLGVAVKTSFPDLFVAFEVYDYAVMLDDVFLDTWGCTSELAEDIRNAEGYLASHADFLIDKTPGTEWELTAKEIIPVPRVSYSPTLGISWVDPVTQPPRDPGPYRILCAGSMPHFKNYRPGSGFPNWAYPNIIEPILRLSREGDFSIDIFNASHDPRQDHWPAFGGYATLFDARRIAYHARIPLAEVAMRAPSYDFGMFLFSASSVIVDYPLQQSLPNRCMSYISANLPLIVNTEMRYMASMIETFKAGIAIPSTEIEDLPRRIREADLAALRRGAAALHRHLVKGNVETLQAFKACLSEEEQRVR